MIKAPLIINIKLLPLQIKTRDQMYLDHEHLDIGTIGSLPWNRLADKYMTILAGYCYSTYVVATLDTLLNVFESIGLYNKW